MLGEIAPRMHVDEDDLANGEKLMMPSGEGQRLLEPCSGVGESRRAPEDQWKLAERRTDISSVSSGRGGVPDTGVGSWVGVRWKLVKTSFFWLLFC